MALVINYVFTHAFKLIWFVSLLSTSIGTYISCNSVKTESGVSMCVYTQER